MPIFTGDLGELGHEIVMDLFRQDGVDLTRNSCRIADMLPLRPGPKQDMHAGRLRLRLLGGGAERISAGRPAAGPVAAACVCPPGPVSSPPPPSRGRACRASADAVCSPARRGGRKVTYLNAFLCGGLLCAVGQILIDRTRLTPARILTGYVVAGVLPQCRGAVSAIGRLGRSRGHGAPDRALATRWPRALKRRWRSRAGWVSSLVVCLPQQAASPQRWCPPW